MQNKYDTYASWGFDESPFQPAPLSSDERGERLFVGRETELRDVKIDLHNKGKITCVEGAIGVGKTSLINVAAYQCYAEYVNREAVQLLIPCLEPFQLSAHERVDEFVTNVYMTIAQTLILRAREIKNLGYDLHGLAAVDAWLNEPVLEAVEKSIGIKVFVTAHVETSSAVNLGKGFSSVGIEKRVKDWLAKIFPNDSGGVVCIIDNLELLRTSAGARAQLDGLRDKLFNVKGMRWVLCGANGIISSVLSFPRLAGFLNLPVHSINTVGKDFTSQFLETRIKEFAADPTTAYLPLSEPELTTLFWATNFNIRDLMTYADQFCKEIFKSGIFPKTAEERDRKFTLWLDKHTLDVFKQLSSDVGTRAWEVLDTAMCDKLKGTFYPSQYEFFRAAHMEILSKEVFDASIKVLEKFGLICGSISPKNGSGKSEVFFTVTSNGALVHYGRYLRKETRTLENAWLLRRSTGGYF